MLILDHPRRGNTIHPVNWMISIYHILSPPPISLVTVNVLSYQLNHRRRHHRWNVSGPARISTGGWCARLPSHPCTCNSISYKNHIYIALYANDWLRQWLWMGWRGRRRTRWDLGHYCGNGAQHLRVTDGRGFEWHFTRQEFSFLITRNIIICVMTPRPVSPPHTKTIIASWIYQEEKIFCHMEEHTPTLLQVMALEMMLLWKFAWKEKTCSFALRCCVKKENVICYKSKLVDKRTEEPLNWRSLPVQEQQNLLHWPLYRNLRST